MQFSTRKTPSVQASATQNATVSQPAPQPFTQSAPPPQSENKFETLSQNEKLMFAQFRRKINLDASRAQVKKLEYNLCDPSNGLSALKSACADANALGLGGVCVMPAFVKQCSAILGAQDTRKCRLIACIGHPSGSDVTAIKVKAVKRAIKDGADEAEVTVPVAYIRDGNFSYVKREFKKLRSACKKSALRIDTENALLTRNEIIRVCAIAAECGVNSVKARSNTLSGRSSTEIFADIKTAVKDKCTIKAEGAATVIEMSAALDMGASVIGSKNAADVARTILAAAEMEM